MKQRTIFSKEKWSCFLEVPGSANLVDGLCEQYMSHSLYVDTGIIFPLPLLADLLVVPFDLTPWGGLLAPKKGRNICCVQCPK